MANTDVEKQLIAAALVIFVGIIGAFGFVQWKAYECEQDWKQVDICKDKYSEESCKEMYLSDGCDE